MDGPSDLSASNEFAERDFLLTAHEQSTEDVGIGEHGMKNYDRRIIRAPYGQLHT